MANESRHPPEIALRRAAAAHIAQSLARNARLMENCEKLAGARRGDRVAALNAAARLVRADSSTLSMLVRVAQIESVHRTIVDKFGGLSPHGTYSNSNFSDEDHQKREGAKAKLVKLVERHADDYQRKIGKAMVASDTWERTRHASAA